MVLAFGALLLLIGSCQQVNFPVPISAPTNATGTHISVSKDGSSHEVEFHVLSKRDSQSIADQLQTQLTKAGYSRCDSGVGKWESLKHRQDGRVVDEIRLLRFFKTGDPGQLGVIFARQQCSDDRTDCDQRFLVRQINIPDSMTDRGKYIEEICKGTTRIE